MDIKQLKYLIALDETRHFGKAASQCNVTQPTLSMRIRSLEEELGLVLIVRGQRFEGFTPEGNASSRGPAPCLPRMTGYRRRPRCAKARWWANYVWGWCRWRAWIR